MKITIYELLGMVKDGKAPIKIKYDNMIWEYDGDYYSSKNNVILEEYCHLTTSLNDEVEILEEPKVQVELTEKEYLEYLNKINKQIRTIRDYIPKPSFLKLEEEKKIPEKLDKYADVSGNLACDWTFGEKKLKDKINEIIDCLDYLKSKGGDE